MNTHDYLMLSAALERYDVLLKIAEEERRLRAVGGRTPRSKALWAWIRQWFEPRTPSRLVANLRGATDPVPFMNEYYLLSVLTFGTVMAVVLIHTRGRLGSSK